MTFDTNSSKQLPAITSDQWHVVRASLRETAQDRRPYERTIVSEHASRALAEASAKDLRVKVATECSGREQDGVFVRKPHYKTLRYAKNITPKH